MDNKLDLTTWYVVRVGTGADIRTAAILMHGGFAIFIPYFIRHTFHRRNKVWVRQSILLFPGYLFIGLSKDQLLAHVYQMRGVFGVLGCGGEATAIPYSVYFSLREEVFRGEFDEFVGRKPEHNLALGDEVVITKGPFNGEKGQINEIIKHDGARLLVEFMSGLTCMTIPTDRLEAL